MSLSEVITVLWRWVDRDPYPVSPAEWNQRVREVFDWSEENARSHLEPG